MTKDFLLRVSDGIHFRNSSVKLIWGIDSKNVFGKFLMNKAVSGDRLWFVQSKSNGKIIAVATLVSFKKRELGPLIDVSYTNEELGWTKQKGEWDIEVHYTDLYNLTDCNLYSEIIGTSTIRMFNVNKCKVNLPNEYPYIVKYSKVSTKML